MAQAASREEFLGILRTTRYGNRIFGQPDPSSGQENPRLKRLFRSLLDAVYQTSGAEKSILSSSLKYLFLFQGRRNTEAYHHHRGHPLPAGRGMRSCPVWPKAKKGRKRKEERLYDRTNEVRQHFRPRDDLDRMVNQVPMPV